MIKHILGGATLGALGGGSAGGMLGHAFGSLRERDPIIRNRDPTELSKKEITRQVAGVGMVPGALVGAIGGLYTGGRKVLKNREKDERSSF